MISLLTLALIVLFVLFLWKGIRYARPTAKELGEIGEEQVASRLEELSPDNYIVINDLLLHDGSYTTQIDHLVISRFGLFVIETKNIHGKIYGSDNKEFWSQYLPDWGYKRYGSTQMHEVRNPLWQNAGHIRALRKHLGQDIPIQGIIAFPNEADVRVNVSQPVLYWRQVIPYIKQFDIAVLSDEDVIRINNLVLNLADTTLESRQLHLENIARNKERRNQAVLSGKCPLCGGELVPRSGRYGKFYGCSNYPNCNYTLN